jgi:hypothetical protein
VRSFRARFSSISRIAARGWCEVRVTVTFREGWLLSTAMNQVLLLLLQQVSEDSLAQ